MADYQHNQTRPKFTWLFLATQGKAQKYKPVVLRTEADTEAQARQKLSGNGFLIFAAKIRSECSICEFSNGWITLDVTMMLEADHA